MLGFRIQFVYDQITEGMTSRNIPINIHNCLINFIHFIIDHTKYMVKLLLMEQKLKSTLLSEVALLIPLKWENIRDITLKSKVN